MTATEIVKSAHEQICEQADKDNIYVRCNISGHTGNLAYFENWSEYGKTGKPQLFIIDEEREDYISLPDYLKLPRQVHKYLRKLDKVYEDGIKEGREEIKREHHKLMEIISN